MLSAVSNPALSFARQAYRAATADLERSMERLATGQKLNRASDDPSGMMSAEQLRSNERRLTKRVESIDFEDAMLGAREGASSAIADSLIDLQGMLTRFANSGGLSDQDRASLQGEVDMVLDSIDYMSSTASFNGQQLISGRNTRTLGLAAMVRRQQGDGEGSDSPIRSPDRSGSPMGFETLASLRGDGLSRLTPEVAQQVLDAAAGEISGDRAAIGRRMQDLASERQLSLVELENTSAARSLITDTDIGQETAALVRAKLMQDASLYTQQMAAQRQSEVVLDLLKSAAAPTVNVRIQLT
jgi:flagellin